MENIIKVKLGDIKSSYLHYSMGYLLGNEKVNIFKVIIECLFILLFGLVGVLLTILFHKRCFHFFYKHINSDYISPHTYTTLGNGVFSRVILVIISIFLSLFTFIILVGNIKENLNEGVDCDWYELYKSIKDNGYDPNKFPMGYIKVDKPGGKYLCRDGNHRHRILLDMYGPDKIIDVIYDGISYHD
jgi:uncharacterized membrane protein